MSQAYRKERLDELMLRELDSIISHELADPRVGDVVVSRVDTSRDLQVARIYISLLDESLDPNEAMQGLQSAQGFIRAQIAERINLRRVPELVFRLDRSSAESRRIESIIDSLTYADDVDDPDAETS